MISDKFGVCFVLGIYHQALQGAWPIIGHLHLLGLPPHKSLNDLSAIYGPIMYMRLGLRGAIVISSPELAKEVSKNHNDVFSNRPHFIIADLLVVTNQGVYR